MTFGGQVVDMVSEETLLIEEFRMGKTKAFEQVFVRHHGAICYFAHQFVKDEEDAKDLVSEVFIKLWSLREDFANLRSIKAFLYVSARNACLNYLRRSKMIVGHKQTTLVELSKEEQKDVVTKNIFEAEVIREVYEAIEALPRQPRKIVKLSLQGLNTDDIATMMNISPQTVRNVRVKAAQALKKQLGDGALTVALFASVMEVTKL